MAGNVQIVDMLGNGWTPIIHLADLSSRLLEADLEIAVHKNLSLATYVQTRTLRRKRREGAGLYLFLAKTPLDIPSAIASARFRKAAHARALWIIDSFRTSDLKRPELLRDFDIVCYTQAYDRKFYEDLFGSRALHLPWGTNALDFGTPQPNRRFDILRVGRQPRMLENDAEVAERAMKFGLTFQGRPPASGTGTDAQEDLMSKWYGNAKYVLASTNLVDESAYTHKSKEYITARWTDSLAAGATIAGAQPLSDLEALWSGAVVDLRHTTLDEHLDALKTLVESWTPERAARNYQKALASLDWRWRLHDLLAHVDLSSSRLNEDLDNIRDLTKSVS